MNADFGLLEKSFQQIRACKELFAKRFYEELFDSLPHLKPVFARTDLEAQRLHFVRALEIIVMLARERDKLLQFGRATGARHVQYGVSTFDLAAAVPLLLQVMGDVIGPQHGWNAACKNAWAEVLWIVITAMREGATEVGQDAPQWDDLDPPTTPGTQFAD